MFAPRIILVLSLLSLSFATAAASVNPVSARSEIASQALAEGHGDAGVAQEEASRRSVERTDVSRTADKAKTPGSAFLGIDHYLEWRLQTVNLQDAGH